MNKVRQIKINALEYNSVLAVTRGFKDIESSLLHIVGYVNKEWCVLQVVDVDKKQGIFVADVIIRLKTETKEQAEFALVLAKEHLRSNGFKVD